LVGFALDVKDFDRVTVTVPDDTGEIVTRHCSPPRCSTRRALGKGEGKRPHAPLPPCARASRSGSCRATIRSAAMPS
jgi:hypothetical protein